MIELVQANRSPEELAKLPDEGLRVGRTRVARFRREEYLRGVSGRRGLRATRRDTIARPAPDRVRREFTASERDRLYVADIAHAPTWAGVPYLAAVFGVFSHRVVGCCSVDMRGHEKALATMEPSGSQLHCKM